MKKLFTILSIFLTLSLSAQLATSAKQTEGNATLTAIYNKLDKQVVTLTTTLQSTGTVTNYVMGQTIASNTLGYTSLPLNNGLYTLISIKQKFQVTYYSSVPSVNPTLYSNTLTPVSDGNFSFPSPTQDDNIIYSNANGASATLWRLGSNLIYNHYPNSAALNAPITFSVNNENIYLRLLSSDTQTISNVPPSNTWAFTIKLIKHN
jgi:hypothetical protein